MTWTCEKCGKVNEDGRLWCILCAEVHLGPLEVAHFAAVDAALDRESEDSAIASNFEEGSEDEKL